MSTLKIIIEMKVIYQNIIFDESEILKKKERKKGTTRIWTEVMKFKASCDNQLHHGSFPILSFCFVHYLVQTISSKIKNCVIWIDLKIKKRTKKYQFVSNKTILKKK